MNCRTAEKEDIGKVLEYIRKPAAFENRPDEVKVDEGTEDFTFALLYGSRREEEILFKEELAELERNCDRIKVIRVLSDEKKEGYRYGFITKEPISEAAEKDRSIFVCGSQGINDYIEKQTGELGTAKKDVALTRMAGCERPQQDPVISI